MPTPRRSAEECELWVQRVKQAGSVSAAARIHGTPVQTVQSIITDARTRDPECLPPPMKTQDWASEGWAIPARVPLDVAGKTVLVGGDLHCWDGPVSLAWRAFVTVAKEVRPDVILLGGDMVDGARVSRHAKAFGSRAPKVSDELNTLRAHLDMLPPVWFRGWAAGNHDERLNGYLANNAPELEDYAGSLYDRFPEWEVAWAFTLSGQTELRHRFRGGIHSTWNNVLHGGVNMVSFHTHQQGVRNVDNRLGRRWGVEPGCLADPAGPQFQYAEGTPSRAAMGFCLLTFDADGDLMPPEMCEHINGRMIFRGRTVIGEKPRYRVKALRSAA